jgi:hypothetical protein
MIQIPLIAKIQHMACSEKHGECMKKINSAKNIRWMVRGETRGRSPGDR